MCRGTNAEGVKDCEFRTVPKEKDAILDRVGILAKRIEFLREKVVTEKDAVVRERMMREILDKFFGLDRFVECLEREFQMKKEDVLGMVGYRRLSVIEKARMMRQIRGLRG